MTIKKYLAEPGKYAGEVTVVDIIAGERPALRVAETWFHPQGGGQKADRGTVGPVHVTHVGHNGGEVDHFVSSLDGIEVGKTYPFTIDTRWRKLNMAYHTAGHLIAGIVEGQYSQLHAVAGHQWPGEARVEFEGSMDDCVALGCFLQSEIERIINA